jgi:AraC-like DNA-binding protein
MALVRPSGLSGAMVAGIYQVVPRPYPVQLFDEMSAAVAWLGAHDPLGATSAEIVEMVTALYEEAVHATPIVARLRTLLEATPSGVDLEAAAKALGTSERSLQRRLREAETGFSTELGAARVRVAQRLLLSGDAPLTDIALEVGCASLQHFGVLFRKVTGESPSAWREREREATRSGGSAKSGGADRSR